MKNILKIIGTGALALAVGAAVVVPADAAPPWMAGHYPYHHHSYHHYGYGRGAFGSGYAYGPGYYNYGYDPGPAIVGGLVGGVFGALANRAISGGGSSHVARCEAHYRSYVRATNSYTGYDGARHICEL